MIEVLFFACTLFAHLYNSYATPDFVYVLGVHSVSPCLTQGPLKETGAQLYPFSYERSYIQGQKMRSIYPILPQTYGYNDLHANASAWQRTISTSHAVLAGMYPYMNNNTMSIPVFSNPYEFDYTLYNYDKCPSYTADLQDFTQTFEWKQMEAKYANMTSYLMAYAKPVRNITLQTMFSTWEVYHTQRTWPQAGQQYPPIDDYTFNMLQDAAIYSVTTQYGSKLAKDYFGHPFLSALQYRMKAFIGKDPTFGHKWLMSMGHYPTILNVLAAMGYTGPASRLIPEYNSALVFELKNQTSNLSVFPSGWSIQVRFFNGDWSSVYSATDGMVLELGTCVAGSSECQIDYGTFWTYFQPRTLPDWCEYCQNSGWMCNGALPRVNATMPPPSIVYQKVTDENMKKIVIATLSFVIIVIFIFIGKCVFQKCSKRFEKKSLSSFQNV